MILDDELLITGVCPVDEAYDTMSSMFGRGVSFDDEDVPYLWDKKSNTHIMSLQNLLEHQAVKKDDVVSSSVHKETYSEYAEKKLNALKNTRQLFVLDTIDRGYPKPKLPDYKYNVVKSLDSLREFYPKVLGDIEVISGRLVNIAKNLGYYEENDEFILKHMMLTYFYDPFYDSKFNMSKFEKDANMSFNRNEKILNLQRSAGLLKYADKLFAKNSEYIKKYFRGNKPMFDIYSSMKNGYSSVSNLYIEIMKNMFDYVSGNLQYSAVAETSVKTFADLGKDMLEFFINNSTQR